MRIRLIPALLLVFFISCQKEIKEKFNQPNDIVAAENQRISAVITKQTAQTWLNGQVLNEQNQPVTGATVTCGGKTATTDNKGFYYFKTVLTVNKDYALITVTKPGFMTGFRTFTPNRNRLAYHTEKIILQASPLPVVVASSGGSITADNIKLTFPASSVIRPGGTRYDGNIRVSVRYIDPSSPNFPLMVPGMLSGLNDAGRINALQSFGMANVELRDDAGNKLEIGPGLTVKMEMPAPANGPAAIPLWHFNETYGIWIQQGSATKQGNVYVAEVNHFSIWNIDLEFNNFELNLKFQTTDSTPVANQMVRVYRANNVYVNTYFTDNAGEATLINCPSNESLTLKISFPCDTFVHVLAPVTQSRNETITISGPAFITYQFTGTIRQCNNQPLANQPFQVFLTGPGNFTVLNGISNASGQFNIGTVLPSCQATGLNAQTTAYYNNQYYFSGITPVSPGTNNYNPVLCDTTGSGGLYNDSDVVNIPDPALQQLVRQAINKPSGTIYYADVKNLDALRGFNLNPRIQNLTGLNYLTGLDSLDFQLCLGNITSIAPLATMTSLKELIIIPDSSANIQLSDISPLQNLIQLNYVSLNNCGISDISALQNLNALEALILSDNQISNISPLQNKSNLIDLYLDNNQISNINSLTNLQLLEFLALNGNQISSLPSFQNSRLQHLQIGNNNLASLNGLQSLTALEFLRMQDNQISNISAIQNLTNLKELELNNNALSNIGSLQNLTGLEQLHIDNNQVADITPLQNMNSLKFLYFTNNQLTTIAPVINKLPALLQFSVIFGNSIPGAEINSFRASHPGCNVY